MENENTIDQNNSGVQSAGLQSAGNIQGAGASVGPIIGIIIIVIILIIGALYFWGSKINKTPVEQTQTTAEAPTTDSVVTELNTQSDSDDVASIKQDLGADVYTGLDADVGSIGQELNTQ